MKQHIIRSMASMVGLLLLLCCLFIVPVVASAERDVSSVSLSSLEQIEPYIHDGPEFLAAVSATHRDQAVEKLERQGTGARYFGGITYGYNNEPAYDTSGDKITYDKLTITGGLSFPLLGTLRKENVGKITAETAAIESKYRYNMLSLNNLLALRKAYVTLWIEQQKIEVVQRLLSTEEETNHILQDRQNQGLLLPADRLELLAVYQDAKRDIAASKMRQLQALQTINIVTGRRWELNEKIKAPSLPSLEDRKIDLDQYPEIIFHNNLVMQYEKLLTEKKRINQEAALTVGLTANRDYPGSTGNGAYITFSMSEPLKTVGAEDQGQLAAADDLKRAKQEQRFIRLQLEGQAAEALATASYAAADVNARAAHLVTMTEMLREKLLRRITLPGDTFEQLQHSKAQYYRTVLEMLDHEQLFLSSVIDIIHYVYPNGLVSEPVARVALLNENDAVRNKLLAANWLYSNNLQADIGQPLDFSNIQALDAPAVSFGPVEQMPTQPVVKTPVMPLKRMKAATYVWNAQPFLQSATRTTALNDIVTAGFSKILIALTPAQISDLISPEGKNGLNELLSATKSKGVQIELLLGDPTWVETEHRGELIALIKQVQHFAFDGIHLDIEPDSLPGADTRQLELLEGFADTIKAVKEVSNLPVSISIHPRYLEGDLGALSRQRLLPLGLADIVVMIYSTDPHKTAKRMAGIVTANPAVPFSLAQSVEHSISATESYGQRSGREFGAAMHMLEDELASYGLTGIYIQSWEDYRKGETP